MLSASLSDVIFILLVGLASPFGIANLVPSSPEPTMVKMRLD